MFLVLHGQTEWNRDGRVQGHSDSPLTEHGRHQALTAARILRDRNLPAGGLEIVCSPLGRTQETARIIASELGFDVAAIREEKLLKEISLGRWEGHTNAQVHSLWPDDMAGSDRYNWFFRSPDGETYDDVSKRLRKWLEANPNHDNLVVVTHGVASRILRGLYGGLAFEDAIRLEVARDAVFQLSNGRITKLVAVNGES
jgi:broad specificity phosphatase PhoE